MISRKQVYSVFFCALMIFVWGSSPAAAYVSPLGTRQAKPEQAKPLAIERISAEELKAKLAKKEPVTIIDVRGSSSFAASDSKIEGSLHVKTRRLKSRLTFPPLKDVPRDSEVVTYCACPNDEAAFIAAQTLSEAGFKRVRVLKGGWQAWLSVKGPVVSKPKV